MTNLQKGRTMKESFDIPLGIASFIISFVLLVLGIIAFNVSLTETERTANQLSVFKTDAQQQLSILSQKVEENEKQIDVLIQRSEKQDDLNAVYEKYFDNIEKRLAILAKNVLGIGSGEEDD